MPFLLLGALVIVGILAMSSGASASSGGGGGQGTPPGPGLPPIPGLHPIPGAGGLSGHDVAPIPTSPPIFIPGLHQTPPSPGPVPPPSPPSPPLPAPSGARDGVVTTKTDPLRIRGGPSLSSATLGLAPKGSHLRVDGDAVASSAGDAAQGTPSWYPVTQLSSGISGFAASEFVSVT